MMGSPVKGGARARVKRLTTALTVGVAASVFLTVVRFLPEAPALPIIVGVALGAIYLRAPAASLIGVYLLAFAAVAWQLLGFGFMQLLGTGLGFAVLASMGLALLIFFSRRVDAIALPLAILAVALMLTPEYYVSIPLMVVAMAAGGFESAAAFSASYLLFLAPFLVLENALANGGAAGTLPIVFARFTSLSDNLRPPLSSLNFLSSGLPPNFISSDTTGVSAFVSARGDVVIIPLAILAGVLLLTASAGWFAGSLLGGRRVLGLSGKEVAPFGESLLTPLVFTVLVLVFSVPGIGGFQTGLRGGGAALTLVFMVTDSALLGVALTGTELFTHSLERVELARNRLNELLSEVVAGAKSAEAEISMVAAAAPSVNLGDDRKALAESLSFVEDVKHQLAAARYESLVAWTERVEKSAAPVLSAMPQTIRARVSGELRALDSAALTMNGHLEEAGVGVRYPSLQGIPPDSTLQEALSAYEEGVKQVSSSTLKLFSLYVENGHAYAALTGAEDFTPPLSPVPLLESHDYITAMRLVCEDYWLGQDSREGARFGALLNGLMEKVSRLAVVSASRDKEALEGFRTACASARPAMAIAVLQKVKELLTTLRAAFERFTAEVETAKKMISALDASATMMLKLKSSEMLDSLARIQERVRGARPSLDEATKVSGEAVPIVGAYMADRKEDEDNLIMISQYPIAERAIRGALALKRRLSLAELPFRPEPAAFFARLFVASNKSCDFDPQLGVVEYRGA